MPTEQDLTADRPTAAAKPFVCRIWNHDADGNLVGRTLTYALDDSDIVPALNRWGEPVGTAFGSALDLWAVGPRACVLFYPRWEYDRASLTTDMTLAGIPVLPCPPLEA